MATVQIKETLHEYIDTADEKKLKAIYTVLKDSIPNDYEYSPEELTTIYINVAINIKMVGSNY